MTHGTTATYAKGCRCDECRSARNAADRHLRRMKAYGRDTRTDAEPVREHIRWLFSQGMTHDEVAAAAGTSIDGLLYGWGHTRPKPKRIKTERATALLAVKPKPRPTVIGCQRRVQALVALGWTQSDVAEASGINFRSISRLVRFTRGMMPANLDAIARAYDQLSMALPPPGCRADTARARAARNGWPPPLAWDDELIDQPDARPAGAGRSKHATSAATEAAWRVELGETVATVAADLGVTPAAIKRGLSRDRAA